MFGWGRKKDTPPAPVPAPAPAQAGAKGAKDGKPGRAKPDRSGMLAMDIFDPSAAEAAAAAQLAELLGAADSTMPDTSDIDALLGDGGSDDDEVDDAALEARLTARAKPKPKAGKGGSKAVRVEELDEDPELLAQLAELGVGGSDEDEDPAEMDDETADAQLAALMAGKPAAKPGAKPGAKAGRAPAAAAVRGTGAVAPISTPAAASGAAMSARAAALQQEALQLKRAGNLDGAAAKWREAKQLLAQVEAASAAAPISAHAPAPAPTLAPVAAARPQPVPAAAMAHVDAVLEEEPDHDDVDLTEEDMDDPELLAQLEGLGGAPKPATRPAPAVSVEARIKALQQEAVVLRRAGNDAGAVTKMREAHALQASLSAAPVAVTPASAVPATAGAKSAPRVAPAEVDMIIEGEPDHDDVELTEDDLNDPELLAQFDGMNDHAPPARAAPAAAPPPAYPAHVAGVISTGAPVVAAKIQALQQQAIALRRAGDEPGALEIMRQVKALQAGGTASPAPSPAPGPAAATPSPPVGSRVSAPPAHVAMAMENVDSILDAEPDHDDVELTEEDLDDPELLSQLEGLGGGAPARAAAPAYPAVAAPPAYPGASAAAPPAYPVAAAAAPAAYPVAAAAAPPAYPVAAAAAPPAYPSAAAAAPAYPAAATVSPAYPGPPSSTTDAGDSPAPTYPPAVKARMDALRAEALALRAAGNGPAAAAKFAELKAYAYENAIIPGTPPHVVAADPAPAAAVPTPTPLAAASPMSTPSRHTQAHEDALDQQLESAYDDLDGDEPAAAPAPAPAPAPRPTVAVVAPAPAAAAAAVSTPKTELQLKQEAMELKRAGDMAGALAKMREANIASLREKAAQASKAGNREVALDLLRQAKAAEAALANPSGTPTPATASAAASAPASPQENAVLAKMQAEVDALFASAQASKKAGQTQAALVSMKKAKLLQQQMASLQSGGPEAMAAAVAAAERQERFEQIRVSIASMIEYCTHRASLCVSKGAKAEAAAVIAQRKEWEAQLATLLTAFKNPLQPPPRFHYDTVNEQEEVVDSEVDDTQLRVEIAHSSELEAGEKAFSSYVILENPFNEEEKVRSGTVSCTNCNPAFNFTHCFEIKRGKSMARSAERKRLELEVFHSRGFLRSDVSIGRAKISLAPLLKTSSITVDALLDEKPTVGGLTTRRKNHKGIVHVTIRLRTPLETPMVRLVSRQVIVIDGYPPATKPAAPAPKPTPAPAAPAARSAPVAAAAPAPAAVPARPAAAATPATAAAAARPAVAATPAAAAAARPPATAAPAAAAAARPAAAPVAAPAAQPAAPTNDPKMAIALDDPFDSRLFCSNDVFEYEIKLCDEPGVDEDGIRKMLLETSLSVLQARVESGKLTLDEYLVNLKNAVDFDQLLIRQLIAQNRRPEAARVLKRVNIMKAELQGVEDARARGEM